ncbi:BgTH12-04727 [Blumeria graminis f. sp. triticale]|uniref:BgTH12-04727 n=1 Tax=Blumeria graminis f. sp. triticale TaxID=1689686 RepID=A0A9W4CUV6_BLUGR|nr:BgTH12-04727 [Blumeria graminis f. sp. triticale]
MRKASASNCREITSKNNNSSSKGKNPAVEEPKMPKLSQIERAAPLPSIRPISHITARRERAAAGMVHENRFSPLSQTFRPKRSHPPTIEEDNEEVP